MKSKAAAKSSSQATTTVQPSDTLWSISFWAHPHTSREFRKVLERERERFLRISHPRSKTEAWNHPNPLLLRYTSSLSLVSLHGSLSVKLWPCELRVALHQFEVRTILEAWRCEDYRISSGGLRLSSFLLSFGLQIEQSRHSENLRFQRPVLVGDDSFDSPRDFSGFHGGDCESGHGGFHSGCGIVRSGDRVGFSGGSRGSGHGGSLGTLLNRLSFTSKASMESISINLLPPTLVHHFQKSYGVSTT
ncbi:hypothetical protein LguiA_005291 [Lonicera macranthoides]